MADGIGRRTLSAVPGDEIVVLTQAADGFRGNALYTVSGNLKSTGKGLDFFILDACSQLDYESMYAGIVAMGLLGVVLYEGVEILDRTLCRWNNI